jgi:hypothetical protein
MAFTSWLRNWKHSIERRRALYQALRRKTVSRRLATQLRLELLEDRWLLSADLAYVVTSTADTNTPGTLRFGINQVNAGNYNEIDFNIGTVGSAQTINLTSQLPALTASGVYINGLSQGGSSNTTRLIELNGTNAGAGSDGLLLQGLNCTVSGLIIESFGKAIEIARADNIIGGTSQGAGNIISGNSSDGVLIDSGISGVQVLGNYIGTNAYGTAALANKVGIEDAGSSNTIGGSISGALNLISGNSDDGVLIDSGASGNLVLGNAIGLNTYNNAALGNGNGIEVAGNNNTVGASYAVAPNVISGSGNDGVLLDKGSNGNQVLGNYIGTNAAGTSALGNKVGIEDAGSSNTIGGSVLGARNVISGNIGDGVLSDSTATSETIQGNYVGLAVGGTTVLANSGNGIEAKGTGTTIGGNSGSNYFTRNFIGGNGKDGVLFDNGASGNQVLGNFIGIGVGGTIGVGNVANAIEVASSSSNTIGGTTSGAGNVLSGSGNDGVLIDSTGTNNLLQGNYVGTDYSGQVAVANSGSGIEIQGTGNTVGGTVSGARNILAGNSKDGVRIDSTASGTLVQGDWIGINAVNKALANSGNGVNIAGNSNTVGGTVSAARNIISGNTSDGVLIASGASGNQLLGNYIGTDFTGTASVANSIGIEIAGSSNTIGGSASGARNFISGNSKDGVKIDSGGSSNVVLGNYIGLNVYGSAVVGNSGNGVEAAGNSNTIGALWSVAPNVISGNSNDGVLLDSGSSGNQVLGNYIGTNLAGATAFANKVGIEDAGSSNTIGGSVLGARNVISGNTGDGVLLDSTATGESMWANYIGVNVSGNVILANGTNGIEVQGTSNTIGGNSQTNYFTRNFISGNSGDGVLLDSSGSGNQVLGNFIGVAVGSTNGVGNVANAIEIAASSNTIGGTVYGVGNVISGNGNDGVLIDSTGANNLLQGNYVGLSTTDTALTNSGNGIEIQGTGNTVGGSASGALNIISGNTKDGVKIDSGGSGNLVLGNHIGVNFYDSAVVGNSGNGVEVAGNSNTIGALWSVAPNEISGNSNDGVLLDSGSSGNQVLGNYIGTNHSGTAAFANKVGVEDAGSSNTIGGSVLGARNVISGNTGDGVLNDSTATGELIESNYIGLSVGGNAALANGSNGVEIQGAGNTIGGNSYFARNFFSCNAGDGLLIDSSASGNQVLGNFIGLGISGTQGVGNVNGIEIAGSDNTIGGLTASDGSIANQVISANRKDGVVLDSGATGNLVQGNYIGTDYTGTSSEANSVGIEVKGNSNTLGGAGSNLYNVVSGNSTDGILIDSGVSGTLVQGNYIGTDYTGTIAVANSIGIEVAGNSNTVGGTTTAARNIISGNTGSGVTIDSTASGTLVEGNYIGINASSAARGNGAYGVSIAGNNNTIGGSVSGAGNTITDNISGGVLVSSGAGNTISQNSIFANGAAHSDPGITLDKGANNNLAASTLNLAWLTGSGDTKLFVIGSLTVPTANVSYVLEFFATPSGDAEGEIYLGSLTITPTRTGTQYFLFLPTTTVTGTYPLITATLTDVSTGDTSAFSTGLLIGN